MNFVETHCIVAELNEPAVGPRRYDFIGLQPEGQLFQFEDLLDLTYELHCELLLPHIVVAFHHEAK